MKIFLDCEFTRLSKEARLISIALVPESGPEFYVELSDNYKISDCNDFVVNTVLPQLNSTHSCTYKDAQRRINEYLTSFDQMLEVCTDAPDWDWEFLCDLAYVDGRWPSNVINRPTNLIEFYNAIARNDVHIELPDLPHHALLDARILARIYGELYRTNNPPIPNHQKG